MTILTRFVLAEFWKIFGLCLVAFLGIYYVVDIFNHMDIFVTYKAPLLTKFAYFLYKLPQILYQVVPVVVLISLVTVLGIMNRSNEITALKAAGVNLYRLTLPLLLSALSMSVFIFVNNEYLLPAMNQQARATLDLAIKGKPPRGIFRQSRIWYMGKDNTLYNIEILDPLKGVMEGVSIIRFNDTYQPTERIDALRAVVTGGKWHLEGVVRRTFGPDGGIRTVRRYIDIDESFPETIDDFQKYKKNPDEMNFVELRSYIERLSDSGFNTTPYRTDLLVKTALPFISLVIAFLSVALALRGNQRAGVMANVGLCIAMGVGYWLVLSVTISLGHAGRLPPFVAAWGANLLVGSVGLLAYAGLRQ